MTGLKEGDSFFSAIYDLKDNELAEITRFEGHTDFASDAIVISNSKSNYNLASIGSDMMLNIYSFSTKTLKPSYKPVNQHKYGNKLFRLVKNEKQILFSSLDGCIYCADISEIINKDIKTVCLFKNRYGLYMFGVKLEDCYLDNFTDEEEKQFDEIMKYYNNSF